MYRAEYTDSFGYRDAFQDVVFYLGADFATLAEAATWFGRSYLLVRVGD